MPYDKILNLKAAFLVIPLSSRQNEKRPLSSNRFSVFHRGTVVSFFRNRSRRVVLADDFFLLSTSLAEQVHDDSPLGLDSLKEHNM